MAAKEALANVGTAIRRIRFERGITQEQLAALARIAPETVSRIESGRTQPSLAMIGKVARAFRLTPAELLAGIPISNETAAYPTLRPADEMLLSIVRDLDELEVVRLARAVQLLVGITPKAPRVVARKPKKP